MSQIIDINKINLTQEMPDVSVEVEDKDLSGEFLLNKEESFSLEYRKLRSSIEKEPTFVEKATETVKDIATGVSDIRTGIYRGVGKAIAETIDTVETLTGQRTDSKEPQNLLEAALAHPDFQTKTMAGGIAEPLAQFVTGFIPASKAVQAVGKGGKVIQAMTAGAIADATVFDAHEARLSDLVQTSPALQNPITEYLASDEDDSVLEGKFKNAVEGVVVGGALEGLFRGVSAIKKYRDAKKEAEAEGKTVQEKIEEDAVEEPTVETKAKEPVDEEFIPFEQKVADESAEISVPRFKDGEGKALDEAAQNINLGRLETVDDVKSLVDEVAKADAKGINAARREVITNVELPNLANDLGMTPDELLKRRKGEAFNAEQILAARQILVSSGENLIRLAKKASTGTDADVIVFRKAMSTHRAIQQQVSGLTAEAGRALQQFNIKSKSTKEQNKAIQELIDSSGGLDNNRKIAESMALLDDPRQVGRFVKDAHNATKWDMVYSAWVNGLLSGMGTHAVNILSNTVTAGVSVIERQVAGLFSKNIPVTEASAQAIGMLQGAKDGLRIAYKTLKTGEPIDYLDKVENVNRRAISAESLEKTGIAGRTADFIGGLINIPSRLLTAEDAYFKTVGYRMELHAQAHRQALQEGLNGKNYAKRVQEIINDPPENIKLESINASRVQTFTNELTGGMKKFQQGRDNYKLAKVIVPFFRTPANLFTYMLERTPLAPLSKQFRDDISLGGVKKDLALARMATGTSIMGITAMYAMNGNITGGGHTNKKMMATKRASGWQPYSIKVGDKYYAYNRLDPIGGLLGMSADIVEVLGDANDAEADEVALAATLSVAQNLINKNWLMNVAAFIDAFESANIDPDAQNRNLDRFLQRLGGSAVPTIVADIERKMDPTISATYSVLDRIKSRIPGFSDDLPPRRNIFGEPIVPEGGLGPDIMSPIYTSTDKKDKVIDELVANETPMRMPPRIINDVELNGQEYDDLILTVAGIDTKGNTLKEELQKLISSNKYKNASAGDGGGRQLLLQSTISSYTRKGIEEFKKNNPRVDDAVTSAQQKRIDKLLGRD